MYPNVPCHHCGSNEHWTNICPSDGPALAVSKVLGTRRRKAANKEAEAKQTLERSLERYSVRSRKSQPPEASRHHMREETELSILSVSSLAAPSAPLKSNFAF